MVIMHHTAVCSTSIGQLQLNSMNTLMLTVLMHATGDGAEEQKCAEQRQWPFVKVCLQSQAERTAKVVGQAILAFPADGGLLTNMHPEHLTSLFPDV